MHLLLLLVLVVPRADVGVRIRPQPGGRSELVLQAPARVTIPGGSFHMGATREQLRRAEALCGRELRRSGAFDLQIQPACRLRADVEGPAVDVYVPTFTIDRREVTFSRYQACVDRGPCRPLPPWVQRLALGQGEKPVEGVTFAEAVTFCRHHGGRLPSEAEWERAARGLGERLYPWGAFFRERMANHGKPAMRGHADEGPGEGAGDERDGFADSAPVGSFAAGDSPYGVQDMAGNVWEWTQGVFTQQPPQATESFAPDGSLFGTQRTVRGGSYLSPPSALRVTVRFGLDTSTRLRGVGFRCAYPVESASP